MLGMNRARHASNMFLRLNSFFISCIGQSKEVDAAKVCGGAAKVHSVETQLTPANIGLGLITLGIYTPRQIRVYCAK
jgi:hypothetical protein